MSNSCLDEKKFKKKCPPPMDCCGKDILFRKVIIPVAMGDDTQYPPENGAFRNALVEYEANHALYIYSSDGLYTKLSVPSGVTSVNGMYGDVVLDIPEKVSQLINDLGFITKNADDLVNYTKTTNLAAVALSGSYNDLFDRPAINNGELTITRNGSALGSFKANQSQNVTMNVQVPTTTAELINNSQFVVDPNYVHTDKNFTTSLNYKLNHLADIYEIGNNLTLTGNRLDANVPAPTPVDSYYDASWILTQTQATPEQYNELLEAANNNQRIVVAVDSEHYYVPEISADQDNITMALSLNQPSGGSVNVTAIEVNIASDDYDIVFNQGVFSGSQVISALNSKPNRSELAAVAFNGNYSSLNNTPDINDGTLTIKQNGSTIGTFSANSTFNETIDIAVPTNTSELNNDSGFITSADTYYDASWLFEESTATTAHYNELKQAILDKKRIYLSQQSESYDALGKIYNEGSGDMAVTITVGTTDSYDGVDYASDIVAMFDINGSTKEITLSVGNTNGADFARDIDDLSAEINNKVDTTTLTENYYNKTENNSFGGIMMPDTTNMTPIRTIEYDVSSNAYFTLASISNNFADLNEVNGNALFRITVTGSGLAVNVAECLWSLRQATNLMPFLIIRNKPGTGASAAANSGIRYIRFAYPRALNNGYSWDLDFNCINNYTRHIKIEIFNQTNNVQWNSVLTQSDYNSTYQTNSSLTLSTLDGISAAGSFNFTVSTATNASYITSYLPKFPSGGLPRVGEAIIAQQFVFLNPEDNLFYPSSNTAKTLDPYLGIQLSSNAVNLNSAIPNTGLRQKYHNSNLTNIPHATLTGGDRCFFRCTMDSNGGIHSDNYVATAMTPGYTWYFVGIASSPTAINIDTTQSMFYTLDANGKLTHINGLEIA